MLYTCSDGRGVALLGLADVRKSFVRHDVTKQILRRVNGMLIVSDNLVSE